MTFPFVKKPDSLPHSGQDIASSMVISTGVPPYNNLFCFESCCFLCANIIWELHGEQNEGTQVKNR